MSKPAEILDVKDSHIFVKEDYPEDEPALRESTLKFKDDEKRDLEFKPWSG